MAKHPTSLERDLERQLSEDAVGLEQCGPLRLQVIGVAEQALDLGAELLALRELVEEQGLVVDNDVLMAKVLRFKSELVGQAGLDPRLLLVEESSVGELWGGE